MSHNVKDKELLEWYIKGFDDELDETSSIVPEGIELTAYNLGRLNAELGDMVRLVDYMTDEQILELIKEQHK